MDTEIGCFIEPKVGRAETMVQSKFKVEAVKLVRERGGFGRTAVYDLGFHESVLRKWVKELGSDPVQAFPGHGPMNQQ
jgi:transposase